MSERKIRISDIAASAISQTRSEYFAKKAAYGEPLKPLGKPCHDCAVECDFYSPITDELALEPIEIQVAASLRWFCHNHRDRACRGNINRLKIEALI